MRYRRMLAALAACLVGCSSGEPFDYIPVTGRITYEDGSAIGAGGMRLQFVSQDQAPVDGLHPRPAMANVDAEGRFESVTSRKHGDGLVPGKHKVAVLLAAGPSGRPLIAQPYTHIETTPLIVDTAVLPLEIKVPKP